MRHAFLAWRELAGLFDGMEYGYGEETGPGEGKVLDGVKLPSGGEREMVETHGGGEGEMAEAHGCGEGEMAVTYGGGRRGGRALPPRSPPSSSSSSTVTIRSLLVGGGLLVCLWLTTMSPGVLAPFPAPTLTT